MQDSLAGWWFRTWILFFHILGMSSSQLTNSYFQRGGLNHQPVVILPYVSWLDGTIVQLHRQCPSRGAQPISKWSYTKFASHFKAVLHYVSLILNHAHHHGQNYSMIAAVTFFCSFFFHIFEVWQPTAVAVWAWFVAKRCTHLPLGTSEKKTRDGVEKHSASRWQDSAKPPTSAGSEDGLTRSAFWSMSVLWQIQN